MIIGRKLRACTVTFNIEEKDKNTDDTSQQPPNRRISDISSHVNHKDDDKIKTKLKKLKLHTSSFRSNKNSSLTSKATSKNSSQK